MPLIQISADFTHLVGHLKRIADALEVLAKRQLRVAPAVVDHSEVSYVDEIADLQKELERDAYVERTAAQMRFDEQPPEVPGAESERQAISAAWSGPSS